MKNYQYKILGKWVGGNEEPILAERIRELVTNGSLTPYDFIREEVTENGAKKWKKFMICKHGDEEFTNIREDWAKLQSVRTRLDKLWKAQRDSLLAQITGTDAEAELIRLRRENNFSEETEAVCLGYWRTDKNDKIIGALRKEMSERSTKDSPYSFKFEKPEGSLAEKRDEIFKWFQQNNSNESKIEKGFGCYSFENDEGVLYVGEASSRTFKARMVDHFANGKEWCEKADLVNFWLLDNSKLKSGTSKQRAQLLERVLILYHQPSLNLTEGMKEIKGGEIRSDTDILLDNIKSEITGLCEDGELSELKGVKKKLRKQKKDIAPSSEQNQGPSEPATSDKPEEDDSGGDE
jgi:hypothetical protein